MDITRDLTDLAHARERTARYAREIGEHELAGRLLKADLVNQGRLAGKTKTDAETDAKLAEAYLAHEREGLNLAYCRDVTHAQAERLRFTIQAALANAELGLVSIAAGVPEGMTT